MTSVWNSDEAKLTQADATAYYRHALGPLRVAPKEGRGWMFAAGELAMTAHDLALWDESLIAQSILKPESYKQMFTEVKLKDGKGTHYGLGVEVRRPRRPPLHRALRRSLRLRLRQQSPRRRWRRRSRAHQSGRRRRSPTIARLAAPVVLATSANSRRTQALAIYRGLQQGRIDRTLLAPNLSDYFTPEALADFQHSLAPLGDPLTFHQTREELRGGMTFRAFQIVYPGKSLRSPPTPTPTANWSNT